LWIARRLAGPEFVVRARQRALIVEPSCAS
jgi:hypothetical protein